MFNPRQMQLSSGDTFTTQGDTSCLDLEARKLDGKKLQCEQGYTILSGWGVFNIKLQAWLFFHGNQYGVAAPYALSNGYKAKQVAKGGLVNHASWVILD